MLSENIKPVMDSPEPRSHWFVLIPWLIVIMLIGVLGFVGSRTQIACHYSGDLMTPAAIAAKSAEGIPVDDDPGKAVKKTRPLARQVTPAYGPAEGAK